MFDVFVAYFEFFEFFFFWDDVVAFDVCAEDAGVALVAGFVDADCGYVVACGDVVCDVAFDGECLCFWCLSAAGFFGWFLDFDFSEVDGVAERGVDAEFAFCSVVAVFAGADAWVFEVTVKWLFDFGDGSADLAFECGYVGFGEYAGGFADGAVKSCKFAEVFVSEVSDGGVVFFVVADEYACVFEVVFVVSECCFGVGYPLVGAVCEVVGDGLVELC